MLSQFLECKIWSESKTCASQTREGHEKSRIRVLVDDQKGTSGCAPVACQPQSEFYRLCTSRNASDREKPAKRAPNRRVLALAVRSYPVWCNLPLCKPCE